MKKNPDLTEAENNPNSGHYYKKLGNDLFRTGEYKEALQNYTKAIEIDDTETVFFSNRARCWKELGEFQKAYDDAKQAIELDEKNIKAHLICGQMLAEIGKSEPGVEKIVTALNRMIKALTLCAGQGKQIFEKDLNKNILRIKKLRWYKEEEIKQQRKIELLDYLKALIEKDHAMLPAMKAQKYQDIVELIGDPRQPFDFEIPEYMCCPLSKTIMDDPVTTQSGFTYENNNIRDYIKKSGLNDPKTREPISGDYIYPNLNIKQSIESFLKENPWAFEFTPNESYHDIHF